MSGTLDDRYFEWLYGLIGAVRNRNPARSYWLFAKQLYSKEFVWLVPNDDNRVEDGKELRYEFLAEQGTDEVDPEWMDLGCSMLEMLVALAHRASFDTGKDPGEWFWLLMQNAGLSGFNDKAYSAAAEKEIDEKLERIIYRTYAPNGKGGLFPLHNPTRDQRKVELWYQMAEYIMEVFPS